MKITKNYDGNALTLSVEGRIDTITSKDMDMEIQDEMGNFNSLIMDFTGVNYISSAGLRVLIATQKKLNAKDTSFVIKNVNDEISRIFRMSGFDKILTIE